MVTDSTAYLPRDLTENLDVTVISLYFDVDGSSSPEGGHELPGRGTLESEFDGDFARFYADLEVSKGAATTSPPTIDDFLATFEPLLAQHSAVVTILLSSGLSPTCEVARQAAARLEAEGRGGERVVVIDSAGTAGHLGLQALAAARAAAAGEAEAEVVARTRQARQEVRQWFLVDNLEYLRRGGRIGSAAAWLGSALDLKPILLVGSEIKAVERVRARGRGVERLVELMRQRRAVGADRWFVQHAHAAEDAQMLVDRLQTVFGTPPEFVSELGPVVATHAGPGTLSVGGLPGAALR